MSGADPLRKLVVELGVLNERLGNLISTFEKHVVKNDRTLEDYDKRIKSLENWQVRICAGFAVITVLVQILIGFFK